MLQAEMEHWGQSRESSQERKGRRVRHGDPQVTQGQDVACSPLHLTCVFTCLPTDSPARRRAPQMTGKRRRRTLGKLHSVENNQKWLHRRGSVWNRTGGQAGSDRQRWVWADRRELEIGQARTKALRSRTTVCSGTVSNPGKPDYGTHLGGGRRSEG